MRLRPIVMTTHRPLSGRTAWVTGAASGIGEACALALADAGASVVLTSRRESLLHDLAGRIRQRGGEARVLAGDITDTRRVDDIAAALGAAGRLDILVNNAGANIPDRQWSQLTAESVDHLVAANLSGTMQVSRAAMAVMLRQEGGGLLIHIASWAAHFITEPPGPIYTAAKSGVVAMSHTINLEGAKSGIRSCVVSPADTHTPLMDKRPTPVSDEAKRQMLQPSDVAGIVVFVAGLPVHVNVSEILVRPTFR